MSIEHWIWLSALKIDKGLMHALLDHFVSPLRIFEAGEDEFRAVGMPGSLAAAVAGAKDLGYAKSVIGECAQKNIKIITMQDAAYPSCLRNIELPPVVLYVGGHMPSFDEEVGIAVVGTRKASRRAEQISYAFGYELADKGILVISGMAMGIDAAANNGALAAGRKTVAVLGGGVDVCYPAGSRGIYDRLLVGSGCLLSEYPPGTRPYAHHFPERNRIISGLASGALIIAAPERSGSLITANRALEQGREVFVIPGSVDDAEYIGSNSLIKQGAIPVTTPKDIIAYYYSRFPDAFNDSQILAYMNEKTALSQLYQAPPPTQAMHVASTPFYKREQEPPQRVRSAAKSRDYDFSIFSLFTQKNKGKSQRPAQPTGVGALPAESSESAADPSSAWAETSFAALSGELLSVARIIAENPGMAKHIDDIVSKSGFSAAQVLAILTELEIDGVIEALPGKRFKIK